jgi:hypothetical protein
MKYKLKKVKYNKLLSTFCFCFVVKCIILCTYINYIIGFIVTLKIFLGGTGV